MFFTLKNSDVTMKVILNPKSSRNNVIGIFDNQLKISLTAPPIDGKANKALITYLAKLLRHPKSKIFIIKGEKSRQKTLLLADITDDSKLILENLQNSYYLEN